MIADRLWARVDKTGDCWVWQGARTPWGYGVIYTGKGNARTHRVAFELTNGPIPPGLIVMHTCDNPPCCRPDHLKLGTHRDNTLDMVAKARHPLQLSEEVKDRMVALALSGLPNQAIAAALDVNRESVRAWLNRLLPESTNRRTLKKHCRKGHEYTAESSRQEDGARRCRICKRQARVLREHGSVLTGPWLPVEEEGGV